MSHTIKSRLSNSYLIGEIFGMLFFGTMIDRVGRRAGVVAATVFLTLGVVLATAAHGTSELGYGILPTPPLLAYRMRLTRSNTVCSG